MPFIVPWVFFDTVLVSVIITILIKSAQRIPRIAFTPMSRLARQMASQLAHLTSVPS